MQEPQPIASRMELRAHYTISGSINLQNIEFLAITNQTFTIPAATTLTAQGDFTMAGTNRITINTGNININGNIFLKNTFATGGGTATLHILGTGNQIMDGTAIAISQNRLPLVVINKAFRNANTKRKYFRESKLDLQQWNCGCCQFCIHSCIWRQ